MGVDAGPREGVCGRQEAPYVCYYSTLFQPTAEIQVLTDASRSGIGFALIQEGPDSQKRLITCGSRGLNSAEARYAPVELKCLGVVYAIQKCAFYIMGAPKPRPPGPCRRWDWTSSTLGAATTSSWWTSTPGTRSCSASLPPQPPVTSALARARNSSTSASPVGRTMPTPCSSFATALAQMGTRRRSSCSAAACGQPFRRQRGRLSRSPSRRRRRRERKPKRQFWRKLETAVWTNSATGM